MSDTCTWSQQGDGYEGNDCWDTDCGGAFVINEGGPAENDMKFCSRCGRTLEQEFYVVDDDCTDD